MSMQQTPITVTDATFSALVERSPIPVLVNVCATWCRPCQKLASVINELAVELVGRILVAKVDLDESRGIASQFKVRMVPTLLFLSGGSEIDRLVGVQPKSEIIRRLERAMAA